MQLSLANPLSPLLDAGYVEETVRRHFAPLLDATFAPILARPYPRGVTFEVDGRRVPPHRPRPVKLCPWRSGWGAGAPRRPPGYLALHDHPLAEGDPRGRDQHIRQDHKRGWEWLGVTPTIPDRISGVVEVPDLAACLTLNKSDVFRTGPRAAAYLAYRKALQEVVSRSLPRGATRTTPPRPVRVPERLERDIERVLDDLADDSLS